MATDPRDLQRLYNEKIHQLSQAYDRRIQHLSETIQQTILTWQTDAAVRALQRDDSPRAAIYIQERIDELLLQAVSDEREQLLKDTMKQLVETQSQVKELERTAQKTATATSESNQMRTGSITSAASTTANPTHRQQYLERLEQRVLDSEREMEIARQSEAVYRDQVIQLEQHLTALGKKYETTTKEQADLQLKLRHQDEQLTLAREHATEAELINQLTEKKYKAKLREVSEQLERTKQQLKENEAAQVRALKDELQEVQFQANQKQSQLVHELKQDSSLKERQLEEEYKNKMKQLESQTKELEQNWMDERRQLQQSWVDQQKEAIDQYKQQTSSLIESLKESHAQELESCNQRIASLLKLQSKLIEEKEQSDFGSVRREIEREGERRLNEAQVTNNNLNEQLAALKAQLSITHTSHQATEKQLEKQQDEWKLLTGHYNELVIKYQGLIQQETQLTTAITNLTQERDQLKTKYLSLGEKMEHVCSQVEISLANSIQEEQAKRIELKQQYSDERQKWKVEKSALIETVSLQEKKCIDLTNQNEVMVSKLEENKRWVDETKKEFEKERHQSQQTIAQLQQDVLTLQSHRKTVEQNLAEKIFEVEKLLKEKDHVKDFQKEAIANINLQKSGNIHEIENEYALKTIEIRHELSTKEKEWAMAKHTLLMDHEKEKLELWKEAQKQMDAKLDELRGCMFTSDQLEVQLKLKVEERLAEITKTLMYPHQHEALVTSKMEALRAKLLLERDMAISELTAKHASLMDEAEKRHQLKQDELKLRYESEYTACVDNLKKTAVEMDERLQRERKSNQELQKLVEQANGKQFGLESEIRELKGRIENQQLNEQRFLSHISSQSSVIDKLKLMIDEEKSRVNDLPQAERRKYEQQLAEQAEQFVQERTALLKNHQEQLGSLQEMLETEKRLLTQANEQRELVERDHREYALQLSQEQRAQLSQLQTRLTEQQLALEQQHQALWVTREKTWHEEQDAREAILSQKLHAWEDGYKNELENREKKLRLQATELMDLRDRNTSLESQVHDLQHQLHETAALLEQQLRKSVRNNLLPQTPSESNQANT